MSEKKLEVEVKTINLEPLIHLCANCVSGKLTIMKELTADEKGIVKPTSKEIKFSWCMHHPNALQPVNAITATCSYFVEKTEK